MKDTSDRMVVVYDRWKPFRMKALLIRPPQGLPSVAKFIYICWGMDIWLGRVPFLKLIIVTNIIMWILIGGGFFK